MLKTAPTRRTRMRNKEEEKKEDKLNQTVWAYSFSVNERENPLNRSVAPKKKKKAKSKPKKPLQKIEEQPEINIKRVQASFNFTKTLYE